MLPLLLIDAVIWYGVLKSYKRDRESGPYPENPLYDSDLQSIWESTSPIQFNINKLEEKKEDILIKQNFEAWLAKEIKKDKDLEDYLWEEGYINPQEVIWCEGIPLVPGDRDDMLKFMQIKNEAYLKGVYNSKLLEDGGTHDLHKAWFMLKGCSDYGAEQFITQNVNPWEVDFDL